MDLGYNANLKWAVESQINRVTKLSGLNKHNCFFSHYTSKKFSHLKILNHNKP